MSAKTTGAIGFKGRMMTLTVLEINSLDMAVIEEALSTHIQRSPDFFLNMPVLLSLPSASMDLPVLIALLCTHGLVPVALSNPSQEEAEAAVAAGLGVINDARAGERKPEAKSEPAVQDKGKTAPRAGTGPTRVITKPVRSGQQIYARGSDLICTGAVSEGAEIIADGHIHVYGTLRGRALAGATGDANARIFCRRFEAELVAVAGCYTVAEDMRASLRSKAVQVRLDGENLLIEAQE